MAKPGRPSRVWTEAEKQAVRLMAIAGIAHKSIAQAIKTDDETLRKYFKEDLENAADQANSSVVGALYKNAIGGNVTAQIFWCKTKLGWREKSEIEHSGNIAITPVIELLTKDTK